MLAMCFCDWKCLKERNLDISICQNYQIEKQEIITKSIDSLIHQYLENPLSNAIIFAGLEPMLQFEEMIAFVDRFRVYYDCKDDIVIYTGYYPEEIKEKIMALKKYSNIIIKFGRFEMNSDTKFDNVLGIELISSNQWAERISDEN